ncbi:MAG: hypothetical protein FWD66_02305, partial [Paludibacter sp.]|nr:hypothetical protein [Paludibacter sp.]
MKKRYFLFMALALIFSAASAQNMRRNVFPTGRTLSLEQGQAVNALSAADFNGDGIVSMSPGPEQPPLRAPEIGSVPLSEGFEGTTGVAIPAGWIMTNSYTGTITSGSLGAWMTTGTNVHLGSRAALINLNAAPPAANWGELYSPKLTLTAGKNYQISLWMYWGTATGTTTLDDLEVYLLKGSNPATDPIIATVMDAGPFSGQTPIPQQIWTRFVINFTPDETGSDYYLLFLAGNANAFLATPGNYTGGNIRVDDVNVQELTLKQNDLAITASAYPFSQVPATQSVLPTFSANVQNLGTAAQTNVVVTVQHNGTVIGTSAPVASLDPGQTATLTVTTTTNDPVIVGNNTITYTVSQDQSDDDPSDNSFTTTFTGTPHLFATDDGNMATYSSGTANYRYGTVYTFTQQTTINQVQVYLYGTATIPHNTTANGYTLRIQALTGPNTASATNITSQTFTGVSGTTSVWTNVTLTDPLTVEAGSYFISISVNGTNNNILSDAGTQGRNKLASTNSTGTALSYGTGSAFLHLVVDLQANDIAITPTTGFPYAQIPQSIAATLPFPTTLTATATNVGTATQHNITLSATYNGADLGTSTPIATLAANAMSTAMTVTPPTSAVFPTTLGTNDVVYTVTQTETDANPGDNTVTRNFDITQNIYALDHIPSTITTTGVGYGGSTPSGLGYKVGNLFTISAPVILKQVQIGYGIGATATSHNLVLYRATYTVATGVYSVVLTNVLTPVTVARPAGGGWLTIDVPPTELEPGLYFLGVQSTANDNHAVAYDNIYGNTIYLAATGAAGASVNL